MSTAGSRRPVDVPDSYHRFAGDAAAWLAAHVEELPDVDTDEGFAAHRAWERTLHDAGWSGLSWPREYGGAGGDVLHEAIFAEEYERARGPVRITRPALRFLGPALMHTADAAQRARWLPPMLAAGEIWCQGFSEPGAGSDLAAVGTRAVRIGDGYVVDGQKTWTTYGRHADRMFALVRTGPPGAGRHGLTCLAIDLTGPGVDVRPIRQVHGRTGFAEVFLTGVRVPVTDRIGDEGDGWAIAMRLLSFERGPDAGGPARSRRRLAALAADVAAAGPGRDRASDEREPGAPAADLTAIGPDLDRAAVEGELGALVARVHGYRCHTDRRVAAAWRGEQPGAESSVVKLYSSELDLDVVELGLDLFGDERTAEGTPEFLDLWHSRAGRIYGGAAEIQRTVVADRLLGLPR
ncbi:MULTISPECIES: acyl-CoA dehydrogenase family protein [Pseudonocardia]|uniref:Acyl-CoA dehydrogenase n=2 Tax=Pseudonocardia TaxID=1847 RepID=A0A1Y2MXX4_PSEAH|nr:MULTISPECIES: acyl-CoA dehydrogenase family protein [Pseudonocardia]OSY40064.1 Acyl-CoA dehydrogenase [Pseudonocardia autotrophica]TDN72990.1 alkylation response protein AidB-like acyl-CoA dehydrogenase [Pseudonocardia autotrophica]BBG03710.1 putative acyl-CoA dehydrogenase FadE [Pseudonocardia autotrophica]GEC28399.1 putative acyl-CoA dehydrogenase FadE [Pseudonocardia saturnea]